MTGAGGIRGRVAVITGGTQGIGRATALRLARAGARLALVGRTAGRVRDAAAWIEERIPGTEILPLALDVRREDDMRGMAGAVLDRYGRIDILVACAGILRAPGTSPKMLLDLPPGEWDQVLDANLQGVFLSNRAVLPAMIRQRGGDIVNLSSRSGREGVALDAPYSASKFGVVGLTESLAEEARPYGVRVQAVLPGTFDSEVWSQNGPLPRPAGLPPVDRIADLILMLLTLPPDTCLAPILVEPVGASRKLVGRRDADVATGEDRRLEGRVVLITGGAGGIGLATGRAVAREGGTVVLADLDEARAAAAAAELRRSGHGAGRPHLGLRCDVRSEEDNARLAKEALGRFGRIDALVACAGILRGRSGLPRPLADLTLDEWRQVIDVNLKGMYLSNRAVLPAMIERRRGTILNLSSVSGLRGRAHDAAYCASKSGVIGLSQALHAEVRRYGVRVQAILPDVVDTPLWNQNGPVPRPGDLLPPERVADLAVFMLAQPDDTTLVAPVIAPLRGRRRKAATIEARPPVGGVAPATDAPAASPAATTPAAPAAIDRLLDPFEARGPWR